MWVDADVRRLHVLLRREAAKLRQLLQARDFEALKPTQAQEERTANLNAADGGVAVSAKIKDVQHAVQVLDTAIAAGGRLSRAEAVRYARILSIVTFVFSYICTM